MAVDFAGLLDRKYSNLEAATRGENTLRDAQAQVALGSLDSENALRGAQAFSTTQQGKTFAPLANASIAHTYQGEIPLAQAQTGLVGTEAKQIDFNTFGPSTPQERAAYYAARNQQGQGGAFGLGDTQVSGPPAGGSFLGNMLTHLSQGLAPATSAPSVGEMPGQATGTLSVTDPASADWRKRQAGIGSAGGTTEVQPKGKAPTKAPAQAQGAPAGPPTMQVMSHLPNGALNLHAVMAHAIGALHAAGGATDVQPVPPVPAPGQTTSNGTWGSPTPNQDLRKQMGYGVKAAGGATEVDMGYGGPEAIPWADEGGKFGYAKGTAKVPGKGKPGVDSVPAMLAPREAVLNSGAADHMGRGAIAALNALGAAKMAAQGTPPATPPTPHGVPLPMGAPPPQVGKKPMARGAPPAKKKAARA